MNSGHMDFARVVNVPPAGKQFDGLDRQPRLFVCGGRCAAEKREHCKSAVSKSGIAYRAIYRAESKT